ncbi:helix-turn-helix domain-containing protein [Pontibacter harenae]|uniref:helix-turn-helix domain-containing protein n=1 Tax=Pontibacter harenae TaxID=2894083 RepID=UPI001E4ADA3F|nr:helix-turn-helix domain-containing protein [Pontibacter harenae]
MQLTFLSISDLLIFFQGMLLGLLFLSNPKGKRYANLLLGLFILVFNFSSLHSFFLNSGLVYQHLWLLGFPSLFLFWYGPLLYFYTASLVKKDFTWKRAYAWYFAPALAELLINFILLGLGGEKLGKLASTEGFAWGAATHSFIASLFSIYFVFRSIQLVNQTSTASSFSTIKKKWLKYILRYFLIRFAFWSFYFAVVLLYAWNYDVAQYTKNVVLFFNSMDFLAIFCISFFSFRHMHEIHEKEKEAGYMLSAAQEELYFDKLLVLMQQEKLYRKGDLKMSDVAERLKTNVKYISQLIKLRTNSNFTAFINSYRVEEVKYRMVDEQYRHLTIAAIAEESGFNSKTTFNRVFKAVTGTSPKDFIAQYQSQL